MSNNDFQSEKSCNNVIGEETVELDDENVGNIWDKPMSNITLGFIFTMMTFNFLGLQYILPTIGVCFLYIGLRELRNENKALNLAWIFSIINLILQVLNLIYISTPLSVNFKGNWIIIAISTIFQVSLHLIFRAGLKNVFEKANTKPIRDPILWMVIWRIVVLICAITQLGSIWFIFILIIIFYFYIFSSLYKLRYDLNAINSRPSQVSTRLSSKVFIFIYVICCTFICAICCVGSNYIRLDSREFITPDTSEQRDVLIGLGFSEDILKDITDEEVAMLQEPIYIYSSNELLMFDSKDEIVQNGVGVNTSTKKPGKINLEATVTYVELKDGRMYAFEYFEWKDRSAYWNDGFTISSSQMLELINGKLLYEKDGISYFAPIPRLKGGSVTEYDMFGAEITSDKITGAVNYPFGSDRQRGYIFYQLDLSNGNWTGANLFNYTHNNNPFRIPYSETEHTNLMFSEKMVQHYTNFQTKAYHEAND